MKWIGKLGGVFREGEGIGSRRKKDKPGCCIKIRLN